MNQAAKDRITREARRLVAEHRRDHRQNYQRAIVNPISVEEHMERFDGDPDGGWEQFAHAHPEIAELTGARELFSTVYQRAV